MDYGRRHPTPSSAHTPDAPHPNEGWQQETKARSVRTVCWRAVSSVEGSSGLHRGGSTGTTPSVIAEEASMTTAHCQRWAAHAPAASEVSPAAASCVSVAEESAEGSTSAGAASTAASRCSGSARLREEHMQRTGAANRSM